MRRPGRDLVLSTKSPLIPLKPLWTDRASGTGAAARGRPHLSNAGDTSFLSDEVDVRRVVRSSLAPDVSTICRGDVDVDRRRRYTETVGYQSGITYLRYVWYPD